MIIIDNRLKFFNFGKIDQIQSIIVDSRIQRFNHYNRRTNRRTFREKLFEKQIGLHLEIKLQVTKRIYENYHFLTK